MIRSVGILFRMCFWHATFPWFFIYWIKCCVELAFFLVNLNGSLEGIFPIKQGVKQWNPLISIFIYALYGYSFQIYWIKNVLAERYAIGDAKKWKLSNICLVDDLMIFSHCDFKLSRVISKLLGRSSLISGMYINMAKSNIFYPEYHRLRLAELRVFCASFPKPYWFVI